MASIFYTSEKHFISNFFTVVSKNDDTAGHTWVSEDVRSTRMHKMFMRGHLIPKIKMAATEIISQNNKNVDFPFNIVTKMYENAFICTESTLVTTLT